MSDRTRNVVIIAVVVVALGLIVGMSWSSARTTNDLSASLRRRSPVTDYMTAEFAHNDCRKNLEDRFLAHIADAITGPPDSADARASIAADGAALREIEKRCPTPPAPIFDDDGKLVGFTTTSTTPGG